MEPAQRSHSRHRSRRQHQNLGKFHPFQFFVLFFVFNLHFFFLFLFFQDTRNGGSALSFITAHMGRIFSLVRLLFQYFNVFLLFFLLFCSRFFSSFLTQDWSYHDPNELASTSPITTSQQVKFWDYTTKKLSRQPLSSGVERKRKCSFAQTQKKL